MDPKTYTYDPDYEALSRKAKRLEAENARLREALDQIKFHLIAARKALGVSPK